MGCNFWGGGSVITGMRAGERDAEFRSFYMDQAPRLKRLALFMTGDSDRSADLAQEALLRAYRKWPRIRNEDPGPYVRATLVNLCRNDYRRKMVERRKQPDPQRDVQSSEPGVDESLRVAEALKVLSPIRRATLLLRFYEDMPEAEIARVLDRPLNTVKSDIRRGLERLRPVLDEGARTA